MNFYDAGIWIGAAPIVTGTATFKTNLLNLGSHQLSAVYPVTGPILGSSSSTVPLNVKTVPGVSFLPAKTAGTLGAYLVATGDFNGDGRADLVALSTTKDTVTALLGNGSGGFTQSFMVDLSGAGPTKDIVVADMNRDGKLDIIVSHLNSGGFDVLLGNGDGTFQTSVFTSFPESRH